MLGRPGIWLPVWRKVIAGSWLMASVHIDLMNARWSTTFAVCGSRSLTYAPLAPWRANAKVLGAIGKRAWFDVMVVRRCPLRIDGGRSVSYSSRRPGL